MIVIHRIERAGRGEGKFTWEPEALEAAWRVIARRRASGEPLGRLYAVLAYPRRQGGTEAPSTRELEKGIVYRVFERRDEANGIIPSLLVGLDAAGSCPEGHCWGAVVLSFDAASLHR